MSDKNEHGMDWMTNPERTADAMRDATLDTIDGLVKLQGEMRKAMEKNVTQLRKESDKVVAAANKAFDEAFKASFEASDKAMSFYKQQIERMVRPDTRA
jgi:aspartate aminotransferase-like enzyme